MRKSWIASLAALVLAAAPAVQAETKSTDKGDTAFVQQALKSGQEEVAIAKLAAEKAQSAEVKQFAQMLVSDHTAVNEQLALLAQRNDAAPAPQDGKRSETSPPATAPGAAPSSPKLDELSKLTGADFDKRFLAIIVEGHEKSVELWSKQAETGAHPGVKKLATETLPKIRTHLQQAKSLQQTTEKRQGQ
jgi:putative membrane protein